MKRNIILVLVTAIVFTGIGAFAYAYTADEIGYGTGSVKDAIDDLYTKSILDFENATYNTDQGHAITSRSSTVNVTKGKYLIVRNEVTAWADVSSATFNNGSGATNKTLSCSSNNCTIRQLSGYYNNQDSGSFGSYKFMVSNATNLFYVEINEDTDVITANTGAGESSTSVQYITLESVKIK